MSASTEKAQKLNNIIQNFYYKAAQVILQSRIQHTSSKGSTQPKVNKWFSLELAEPEAFRKGLQLWRAHNCITEEGIKRPPPLVIETYLDARDLNPHQSLTLVDAHGNGWSVFKEQRPTEVVLERWIVEFNEETSDQDVPVVYKKCAVLFRALYTHCRVLPTWSLSRRLQRSKLNTPPMTVGCRVLNGSSIISSKGRVGLTKPIVDSGQHLETFKFGNVMTPAGGLRISVSYRTNNEFRVTDSERVLSSRFLEEAAASSSLAAAASTSAPKPTIQPFKSPSLSASPSDSSRSLRSQSSSTRRKYSSSFGKRQSFTESPAASPGSGLYIDDDDLGSFVKMVDSAQLLKDKPSEEENPLAKFQVLRGNHAALSDSLQSSLYMPKESPRGHAPLVPSRLSEEYKGTAPSTPGVDQDDDTMEPRQRGYEKTDGEYQEQQNDDDELLFAMSDMHVKDNPFGPLQWE